MSTDQFPKLGLGLGLRNKHFKYILTENPEVDWFEAISENFMDSGGRARFVIRQIAERYPLVLHGVSLSIGSTDPLDFEYLKKLKSLAEEVNPVWISDHLCWTGVLGKNSHDLLPLPLNEESFKHVAERINRVQDFLERPIVLENPSTYLQFTNSTISESDFLSRLAEETGCRLLLDINNVYVTCYNSESDPFEYLENFPFENVVQIHLAGHQNCGTHIIDTHDRPVLPEVWELYRFAYEKTGGVSTMLEWDGNIPSFEECHQEILKAKNYMESEFEIEKTQTQPETESISNPVDFLVPEIMENTLQKEI